MKPFHTTEVDLAAFLRCRGVKYLRLERNRSNPKLVDFVFDDSDELWANLREWASENGPRAVDARQFGKVRKMMYRNVQRYLNAPE